MNERDDEQKIAQGEDPHSEAEGIAAQIEHEGDKPVDALRRMERERRFDR